MSVHLTSLKYTNVLKKIGRKTVVVGDFNTPLSQINRPFTHTKKTQRNSRIE
jgi:hypothetical protein